MFKIDIQYDKFKKLEQNLLNLSKDSAKIYRLVADILFEEVKKNMIKKFKRTTINGITNRANWRLKKSKNLFILEPINNVKNYAYIQNFGGRIPVTGKMKSYFWAKYKETGDVKYKYMALTKKTHFIIQATFYNKVIIKNINEEVNRLIYKEILRNV